MPSLKPLLPFALIALATPAFAQADISLLPDDPSSAESSIDLSLSSEASSSEPNLEISNSVEPSSEEPSAPSSEEASQISNPDLPPPPPPGEMFQIFFDTCTSLSGGDTGAYDKANDAGWVPYEGADYGPYKSVYTGARDFEGYGSVEVWGSLETLLFRA